MPAGFRPASFTDRVMAGVANEPRPTPARVFLRSLRHLALRDALASLHTAWRLALGPGQSMPRAARARSAALLLAVVLVVGVATPAAFTSMRALIGPDGPAAVELDAGAPASVPPTTPPTPTPSPTLRPTPTPTDFATPPATKPQGDGAASARTRPQPTRAHEADEESTSKTKRQTPEPGDHERDEEAEHEDD
jgi:hypothetical protein